VTAVTGDRPGVAAGCLLCCRPIQPAERRCPAFALAGIATHAGCCGGCASGPTRIEAATTSSEAAA
jgi:hypothetical protein